MAVIVYKDTEDQNLSKFGAICTCVCFYTSLTFDWKIKAGALK